jgi:glycine oxidase
VIGSSIAWRCAKAGLKVLVVDPQGGRGASWAAAGLLAPVTEAHYGEEALLKLNLESARRYPDFIAELEDLTDIDTGYRRTGTVVVARDADDRAALDDLYRFQQSLDLDVEWLSGRDCRVRVPGLSPRVQGGMFVAEDHQVDNRALLTALIRACDLAGVERVEDRVDRVVCSGDQVTSVSLASGSDIPTGRVVVAAGSWSTTIHLPLDPPPVRPVKGQLLHLRGLVPIAEHNVRGLDVYLVPRVDGRLIVGATVEEQGFDLRRTAEAAYLLLRDAYEIFPGVLDLELTEHAVGVRPATPDNAPLIGESAIQGLVFATGHFRNGVLLAPITADAIAELLASGRITDVVKAFSPQRFIRVGERVG